MIKRERYSDRERDIVIERKKEIERDTVIERKRERGERKIQ